MQSFHGSFTRYKGATPAGGVTILENGATTLPAGAPGQLGKLDNLISFPARSASGPTKRLAVNLAGPATGILLFLYMFDAKTQTWMLLSASGASLSLGMQYLDLPVLQEQSSSTMQATGTVDVLIQVTDTAGGVAAGAYVITAGGTLN